MTISKMVINRILLVDMVNEVESNTYKNNEYYDRDYIFNIINKYKK